MTILRRLTARPRDLREQHEQEGSIATGVNYGNEKKAFTTQVS